MVPRRCQNHLHIAFSAMLSGQALCVIVLSECAGRVDPREINIGGRNADENAHGKKSGPHGVTFGRVSR
jgi:hypothetical protein